MILRLGYSRGSEGLVVIASYLLGMAFIWLNAFACFNINDDGVLSHLAERALNGELPHIDFEDSYTGALTYLHALSFKIGGESIASRRYCLILASALFVAYLMQYLRRSGCSLYLILSAQWLFILGGLLHFPESTPNWYVIYLGVIAFTRIIKLDKQKVSTTDLCVAGLALGLAPLFKINSVVFILAASWILILERSSDANDKKVYCSKIDFYILLTLTALFFLLLFKQEINLIYTLYYILPVILVIISLIRNTKFSDRSYLLTSNYLIFILPAVLPFSFLLAFYYFNSGLNFLFYGIFLAPMKRIQFISVLPPGQVTSIAVILLSVWGKLYYKKIKYRLLHCLIALGFCFYLYSGFTFITPWSIYNIIAYIPLCTSVCLSMNSKGNSLENYSYWIFPMVFALIFHLPFYQAGYVAYTFIFSLIFIVLLFNDLQWKDLFSKSQIIINFSIVLFFSIVVIRYWVANLVEIRLEALPSYSNESRFPKAGLEELIDLKQLLNFVDLLDINGKEILAFPDSSEIYFYLNLKNPTRFIHEVLSSEENIYEKYYSLIKLKKFPIVVINTLPPYSEPLDNSLIASMKEMYIGERHFGRYMVLWNFKESS